MSKTIDIYKKLKKEDKNKVYFFKIGIFYVALDDDAKLLADKYNFKLTNFTPDILKCGFPCTSFYKYYSKFKEDNLDFKIIEDNQVFDGNKYLDSIKIEKLYYRFCFKFFSRLCIPKYSY